MSSTIAKKYIKEVYGNSKNFMTPKIIGYQMIGSKMACELSRGKGIGGNTIIGVSIVRKEGKKWEKATDLSEVFESRYEAQKYIDELFKALAV